MYYNKILTGFQGPANQVGQEAFMLHSWYSSGLGPSMSKHSLSDTIDGNLDYKIKKTSNIEECTNISRYIENKKKYINWWQD